MPLFEYKGVNASGAATKGTIEADSSRTARQRAATLPPATALIALLALVGLTGGSARQGRRNPQGGALRRGGAGLS